MTSFSVKIALLANNGVEFFWIHPFAHVDEPIHRTNQQYPALGHDVETGRYGLVRKKRDRRLDVHGWGRNEGKLFRRAILKSAKPKDRQAFMRRFGLDLDF